MQLTILLNIYVSMKTKEKEDKNTEQAILKAAEKEFLEKGYVLSKTTDIARAAGVTHAMLHYYFRTKDNLFNKVFIKKTEVAASSFGNILDQDLPFTEKMSKFIESHFDFIAANPRLPFFILNELLSNPERLKEFKKIFTPLIASVIAKMDNLIHQEVSAGNIRPVSGYNILLDIITLNASLFILKPILQDNVLEKYREKTQDFLIQRKKEHVQLILDHLKL